MARFLGKTFMFLGLLIASTPARAGEVAVPAPPPPPPTAPESVAPAPPAKPAHSVYQSRAYPYRYRYYRYRPYRPYVPPRVIYRTRTIYRCCPSYRRYARPYHRQGGLYFGDELGVFAVLGSKGPFKHLNPGVFTRAFFGWNFTPIFGLEWGIEASFPKEKEDDLGCIKSLGMISTTLDMKFRLRRPNRYQTWIPYLTTGLGAYFLTGDFPTGGGPCEEEEKSVMLAHGGGIHLGLGVDVYATKFLTVGLRADYRALFMSQMLCGPGQLCPGQDPARLNVVHTITAGLNFAFTMTR